MWAPDITNTRLNLVRDHGGIYQRYHCYISACDSVKYIIPRHVDTELSQRMVFDHSAFQERSKDVGPTWTSLVKSLSCLDIHLGGAPLPEASALHTGSIHLAN